MLEWMQRHKKYLVITVWISAIALVFAGFVEWGSGGIFSGSGNNVAKVGNEYISKDEFEKAFREMIDNINGANKNLQALDENSAKQLGIDNMVLGQLVQKKLLLAYSNDIKLGVSDYDIRYYLEKIPELQENGVFSEKLYKELLDRNKMKSAIFENGLKEQLLLNKMITLVLFNPTNVESDSILYIQGMKQNLKLRFISKANAPKFNVNLNDKDIRSYWEKNKNKYLSAVKFDIAYININLDSLINNENELQKYYNDNVFKYKDYKNFEEAKLHVKKDYLQDEAMNIANIAYIYMKNHNDKIIAESKNAKYDSKIDNLNNNDIKKINDSFAHGDEVKDLKISYIKFDEDSVLFKNIIDNFKESNGLLKPLENENNIIIPLIISKSAPVELEYDMAKNKAKIDLLDLKNQEKFDDFINNALNDDKNMTNVGRLSYLDIMIDASEQKNNALLTFLKSKVGESSKNTLSNNEISKIIQQIFMQKTNKGRIDMADGILLYSTNAYDFPQYEDLLRYSRFLENNIKNQKDDFMIKTFVSYLRNKYKLQLLGGTS